MLRFPRWAQNLSTSAKDLIYKLLTVTPQARITAAEALQHPWVNGQGAAPDNYLESPRTLRKLAEKLHKSPTRGGGGRVGYGGGES